MPLTEFITKAKALVAGSQQTCELCTRARPQLSGQGRPTRREMWQMLQGGLSRIVGTSAL